MAKGPDEAISLFPFMSILACLIGTLTMMIAGLALQQNSAAEDQPSEETIQRANQYAAVQERLRQLQAKLDELQALVADTEKTRSYVADESAELKLAEQSLSTAAEASRLAAEEKRLKKRLGELQKELAESVKQLEALSAELAKRGSPPEAEVVIRPGGSGVDLDPTFVECQATGVVLMDAADTPFIRTADLAASPVYLAVLEQVKSKPKGTIIFLMRDDGQETYRTAAHVARINYVRNGKLPVVGHGKIDLKHFRK
jgi:hypothetical protein